MKKICTIIMLMSLCITSVIAAEITKFSSNFIKNFKDCDSYQETTTSEYEGNTFTTTKQIQGWRNGFCRYQERMKSSAGEYQISCNFSAVQVDELYEAMKDRSKEPEKYELEMFAPQTDNNGRTKFVTVGTQTIKGNKAYIVWAKYQNNPYFCHPQKIR